MLARRREHVALARGQRARALAEGGRREAGIDNALPAHRPADGAGELVGGVVLEQEAGGASPLTGRERDVLVAARDGATVADIAGKLFLSEGTVRNYLSAAIAKTGTRNRVEAVRKAEEKGWL